MSVLVNSSQSSVVVAGGYIRTKDHRFQVEKAGKEIHLKLLPSQVNSTTIWGQGSSYTVNYSGGNVISNNHISIRSGGKIVVDGYDMTQVVNEELKLRKQGKSLLTSGTPVKNEEQEEGVDSYYIGDTEFASIRVQTSGSVRVSDSKHVTSSLSVSIIGSGDVSLVNLELNTLTAQINGSGDIVGDNTVARRGEFQINGSGDITGIHVMSSASGTVCGSGDIRCSVASGCSVSKAVYGSGSVKFSKP
jgi:Putative auto-transporter adhesin, head GIN domain